MSSSHNLKYGHIIRIKPNDSTFHSYITSKSYTDRRLYYQLYGQAEDETKIIPSNYRESLFEILPTSSFQINDEMNEKKNEQSKKDEEIKDIAPRAKTQLEQFKTLIEEKRGKSIFFGDKVVFKHLDSKHYIFGSFDCAQSGIGAFKIQLRKQLSQKIVFQLLPYRTYEKEGDEISIDAPLKIFHSETQCYLSYCVEENFIDYDPRVQAEITQNIMFNKSGKIDLRGKVTSIECPYLKLFYKFQKDKLRDVNPISEKREEEEEDSRERISESVASSRRGKDELYGSHSKSKQKNIDVSARYEIINENIPKRIWKFQPYLDFELLSNKEKIKNHDLVYLLHTKENKYLCPSNETSKVFLNKRQAETDLSNIFNGLWEIQKKQQTIEEISSPNNYLKKKQNFSATQNFLNVSFAQESIRQTKTFLGKSQRSPQKPATETSQASSQKFVLRHLVSGRVICVLPPTQKKESDQDTTLEFVTEQRGMDSCVMLQCLDSKFVNGTLTRLNVDGKQFLQVRDEKKKRNVLKEGEVSHSQFFLEEEPGSVQQRIKEGEEDFLKKKYEQYFNDENLELTKDASEHGFRIYKVDDSIKQIVLFIMSSQEIIYKFLCFIGNLDLKKSSTDYKKTLSVSLMNNVINVFKQLVGFIYGCEYSKIASSGNSPNNLKQRAFDETGMIQLITIMLDEINDKYELMQAEKKIKTIYILGYEVLESVAVNNYQMKIKISRYLKIYLQHIIEKNSNRVVYKSIQQILQGNQLALQQSFISHKIQQLIKTSKDEDDPADLKFLSKLCLCGDRTVQKNQMAVYTYFYKDHKSQKPKFLFQEDHHKYQIASKISKKDDAILRTLDQLYKECEMAQLDGGSPDPSKGHWNYFIEYLNLLADICVGRFPAPIDYMGRNLPLKTLEQFLKYKTVRQKSFYQPFIRLVHHAFVEIKDYEEISRITKVKNWNQLENFDLPRSSSPISSELTNIKDLLKGYIKKINSLEWSKAEEVKIEGEPQTINFDPEEPEILKSVKTFLQILKSTLTLGFWLQMDDLMKIIPYMLKIIAFDVEYGEKVWKREQSNTTITVRTIEQNFKNVKQELKLNKPNIVLLVQCKILAAKIINIIIDYQFNIRVSIITKHFKDVQQQEYDLTNYDYEEQKFQLKWKENKEFNVFRPLNEKEGYLMNEQLWIDKINEIIEKRNIFAYCQQLKINERLALFEGLIYGNQQLTNLVLSILSRITNQRKSILKTFKDIILVAGGNLNKLTNRVETTRGRLLFLSQPSIKDHEDDEEDNKIWRQYQAIGNNKEGMGIVQELAYLTMSMKKNSKPTAINASKFYNREDLYPFKTLEELNQRFQSEKDASYMIITEKQENNHLNQLLVKSQDHHLLIIDFIKIMKGEISKNIPYTALHACYNFLATLVWNNIENKKQLEHILEEASAHLNKNVGCIQFFSEMYKNNKNLVIKTDVTNIVNQIILHANSMSIQTYLKSKLLDFLRNIIIFDNEGVPKNQNIVMEIISQYQVSDNNQIVYLNIKEHESISEKIQFETTKWIQEYEINYIRAIKNYEDIMIGPELFYLATFFEIFSGLIENQNKVNIGKCSNMHPQKFLIQIISKAKNCWPLLRHLRSYINKLYYFKTREKQSEVVNIFVDVDLKNLKEELRSVMTIIANAPDFHTIKIVNPIRYSYIGSYVYLHLEQILHSLDLMLSTKEVKNRINNLTGDEVKTTYYFLLETNQIISYLMKNIDGRYINKYLQKVSNQVKQLISEAPFIIVNSFVEDEKNLMLQNLQSLKLNSEESLFRKQYIFHQNKGFWKHLIDWNAHHEQELNRERVINAFAKRPQKESDEKKLRDYLIEKVCVASTTIIEKKLLIHKPKKRQFEKEKEENQNEQKQEKIVENQLEDGEFSLPANLITSMSQRFKVKNERFQNAQIKNVVINSRRKKLVKFIEVNPAFDKFSMEETQSKLYESFANLNAISKQNYIQQKMTLVGNSDVIQSIVEMNKRDPKSISSEYKIEIVKMFSFCIRRQSSVFNEKLSEWNVENEEERNRIRKAQIFLNECNCASFLCSLIENDLEISVKMANEILLLGILLLFGKNDLVQTSILNILKGDDKNIILIQLEKLIKKNSQSVVNFLSEKEKEEDYGQINYSDTYDFYNDIEKIMERKFKYIPETVLQAHEFEEKLVFLERMFTFLKVLCEGNNQEIKNFIREQADEDKKAKSESINFIALTIHELKKLLNLNQILQFAFSMVEFVNEVTQIPCIDNQLFLCRNTSYFHDFATLERKNINKTEKVKEFFILNIQSCLSCLQGNHHEIRNSLSSDDLSSYYGYIFNFLIANLSEKWKFQSRKELEDLMKNKIRYDQELNNLFNVTKVIVKLKKENENFKRYVEHVLSKGANKDGEGRGYLDYFDLFESNLLGIQIKMDKMEIEIDQNQIIYFPNHPVYSYLSRSTRNIIMEEINRSTHRDKIIGLINTTDQISQEIDYNFELDHQFSISGFHFSISASKINIYQTISLILSTLICFLLFLFVNVIYYSEDDAIEYELGSYKGFINLLSVSQFVFAMIYIVLWLKNHIKLAIGKYELQLKNEKKEKEKEKRNAQEQKNQNQKENEKEDLNQQSWILSLLFKVPGLRNLYCLYSFDKQFWGVFLFTVGSFLGIFYRVEWYSILLINIMMSYMDVLKSVIAAIVTNMKMLGMLSLLGTSFIAIFSIFSINYYASSLYEQQLPQQHCMNVFDCILDLYINEQINSQVQSFQIGRFGYDMLYTIFMDMLFGNIVGGVLIDTFAQLRDKRNQIIEDKQGLCFICGISKETLEKKNEDLKTHYKFQYHKLWNYVFYIYNLRLKEKKVGLQYIISNKIQTEDVSWVPLTGGDEEDLGERIRQLEERIASQEDFIRGLSTSES